METNDQRVYPINIPLNHYKIPLDHQINTIEYPNGNPFYGNPQVFVGIRRCSSPTASAQGTASDRERIGKLSTRRSISHLAPLVFFDALVVFLDMGHILIFLIIIDI